MPARRPAVRSGARLSTSPLSLGFLVRKAENGSCSYTQCWLLWKPDPRLLKEAFTEVPCGPAMPLLGKRPEERKTGTHRKTETCLLTGA